MVDRLRRKKYIGVWRHESKRVISTIVICPARVTRCMIRKNPKMKICRSARSSKPKIINSELKVRFLCNRTILHSPL